MTSFYGLGVEIPGFIMNDAIGKCVDVLNDLPEIENNKWWSIYFFRTFISDKYFVRIFKTKNQKCLT